MSLLHASITPFLLALAGHAVATSISATPHDSYSSSVGVLGCKINTNRVAYWPGSVDCNNICVKLSYGDRSVNLLRIDQSGGAYDISYDAWVYLQTGDSATTDPLTGGGVAMEYEEVDASECADLIHTSGSKLPLSASNSMNFVTSCLDDSTSWVAQNYVLYNICDAVCSLGYDELCTLDLDVSNQPSCTHTLGLTTSLTSAPVYNIEYETGTAVEASTGDVVSASVALTGDEDEDDDSSTSSEESTTISTTTSTSVSVASVAATITSTSSSSSSFFSSSSSIATLAATTAFLATSSSVSMSTSSLDTAAATSASATSTKTPGIFVESASASSSVGTVTTSSSVSASSSTSTSSSTSSSAILLSSTTSSASTSTIDSTTDTASSLITASITTSSSSASSSTTFSATTLSSVRTSTATQSASTSASQTSSSATAIVTTSNASSGATLQLLVAFAVSALWLMRAI